jgi:hypothetical protein
MGSILVRIAVAVDEKGSWAAVGFGKQGPAGEVTDLDAQSRAEEAREEALERATLWFEEGADEGPRPLLRLSWVEVAVPLPEETTISPPAWQPMETAPTGQGVGAVLLCEGENGMGPRNRWIGIFVWSESRDGWMSTHGRVLGQDLDDVAVGWMPLPAIPEGEINAVEVEQSEPVEIISLSSDWTGLDRVSGSTAELHVHASTRARLAPIDWTGAETARGLLRDSDFEWWEGAAKDDIWTTFVGRTVAAEIAIGVGTNENGDELHRCSRPLGATAPVENLSTSDLPKWLESVALDCEAARFSLSKRVEAQSLLHRSEANWKEVSPGSTHFVVKVGSETVAEIVLCEGVDHDLAPLHRCSRTVGPLPQRFRTNELSDWLALVDQDVEVLRGRHAPF